MMVNGKKLGGKLDYEQFEILTAEFASVANVRCGEKCKNIVNRDRLLPELEEQP